MWQFPYSGKKGARRSSPGGGAEERWSDSDLALTVRPPSAVPFRPLGRLAFISSTDLHYSSTKTFISSTNLNFRLRSVTFSLNISDFGLSIFLSLVMSIFRQGRVCLLFSTLVTFSRLSVFLSSCARGESKAYAPQNKYSRKTKQTKQTKHRRKILIS